MLQCRPDLDLAQEALLAERNSELGQEDLYGNVAVAR
jgi:hypothetical protein